MPSSGLVGGVQGGGSIVGPRGKPGERCEFNPLVGFTFLHCVFSNYLLEMMQTQIGERFDMIVIVIRCPQYDDGDDGDDDDDDR